MHAMKGKRSTVPTYASNLLVSNLYNGRVNISITSRLQSLLKNTSNKNADTCKYFIVTMNGKPRS